MSEPTVCPVEECNESVDYQVLYDHLYGDHDASELCATVTNLVAEVGETARLRGALTQIAGFCKLPHENDFDCPSTVAAAALAAGQ